MNQVKEKYLKIAFLTDIHMKWQYLNAIKPWIIAHTNSHQAFNYVFIGGDTQNCNNNDSETIKGNYEKAISEVYSVYDFVKQIFCCPLIYVPGNHDPPFFYQKDHPRRQGQTNAHKRRIDFVEGLQLVGFGGSVPAYIKGDKVWEGYPFNSQEQVLKQFEDTDFFVSKQKSSMQTILLTHDGPQMSSTTHDRRDLERGCISGGVKSYNDFLKNERKEDILIWLHGHVHNAGSYDKINNIQVCNPGPIVYGNFMYIQLQRQSFESKWTIKRKVYQRLDYN